MMCWAAELGIDPHELRDPRCAIALGGLTHGVSPLEQAAAFATFAAKGVYARPYTIERIVDRHGQVVYVKAAETRHPLSATEAGIVNAALERVVNEGTGRGAQIGRPLAGKTGTTENFGNAWFIGYVPQMATAVWVGHPDGDVPMTDVHGYAVTGGSFPAAIFRDYMRSALAGVRSEPLFHASPNDLSLGVSRSSTTRPSPAPVSTSSPATTSTVPPASTTIAATTTTSTTTTVVAPV
jgi:penicillin-binding protein 1A